MNRDNNLRTVRERVEPWDIVVIGGGATGAGCALDAASRGFSVLLLEQHDFGKGTSSRSTKLIHGGVRYLRQGDISLVREALKERGMLLKNAPHAIRKQAFVIPCYTRFEKLFYSLGMKIYDLLSRGFNISNSRILSRNETLAQLPSVNPYGLIGGVLYYDGQFDDTRFLIDLLRTADSHGAVALNYCRVDSLLKTGEGRINGVEFLDAESGEPLAVSARSVINAAGIFSDPIRKMSDTSASDLIAFSQGIHIVLDRSFLPSDNALIIPKTTDGRVLFMIPWHDHVVVGTTDTPVDRPVLEPTALRKEIDFVLETACEYLMQRPTRADVLSTFAGIRPLIRSDGNSKTSSISRGHRLFVDSSGLVTITGGKWTTYRRMAEDAVDKAIEVGGLRKVSCRTKTLPINPPAIHDANAQRIHPAMPYSEADVVHAVREEMARTIEDVIARRTRILFLNAALAVEIAPAVAAIMGSELGKDDRWIATQIDDLNAVARNYLVE